MTGPHFVDSNVFVYRHDRDVPDKQARAQELLERLWRAHSGRVSEQVLSELYVVATRKLATPLPQDVARREIRQLESWRPVPITIDVHEDAWELEDRFSLSCWDALIVAAARAAGCTQLFSEDMQDGLVIDGMRIVNPFARTLDQLELAD
ncbi:MAG TPA: PIN domain-containing protein [Polyangiaceae bacterium]|nr:PIN domain-containing protein [Polyangiaceae bacterium]